MSSALLIPRSVRPTSATRNPTPERLSCEQILNNPTISLGFVNYFHWPAECNA